MMKKLMMHIATIMIGRKTILLLITILFFVATSCEWLTGGVDKLGDYDYISYCRNSTSQTIKFNTTNFSSYPIDMSIQPGEKIELKGSRGIFEGNDVIKDFLFSAGTHYEPVQIFINGGHVKTWEGPPREMDNSINHFFNYNSWHIDTIAERELEVIFTITDSDIEQQLTTFHELGHASHQTKAGSSYWVKYINYIITYGAYGNGTGHNAGYCGVGEMWGNYIGALCRIEEFGANHWDFFNPDEDWYNPGFLWDVDNISDVTTSEIFSCMTSSTNTIDKMVSQLKTKTSNDDEVDDAYENYSDWP